MASALVHLLLFLLVSLLPCYIIAQTYSNVTLGSSLTAMAGNSFWASPSGEFAFGFQRIRNGGFLLAIWFNEIPEKTIVWSANGDNLVEEGSKVELTIDGQFVLNDSKGKQIWRAEFAGKASYAAMLDTGNFVLASRDSISLWESFDHPTDTILPTQTLNLGSQLVARFSEMNYSSGRFLLTLQADGGLILYTMAFPTDSVNFAYWSTGTLGSSLRLIFSQSGHINLVASDGSILYVLSNRSSTQDFYQRAILEYDGVFRHYVYPKSADSRKGKSAMAWYPVNFIPENVCLSITASTGSGACGFNSYCEIGDDRKPTCKCPPGYSFLDPNNTMSGCKQKFVSQNCEEESQESDQFYLEEMINTDWPLSDYEHFRPATEDWCKEACLGDCFCAVAIYRNGNCWKKKIPLSNGRIDPSVGGKALIKTRV